MLGLLRNFELLDQGRLLGGRLLGRGDLALGMRHGSGGRCDRTLEGGELFRQRIRLSLGGDQSLLGLHDPRGDRGGIDSEIGQPAAVACVPGADLAGPVGRNDLRCRRG